MKTFYAIIANTLFSSVTTFFVWFAMTFWLYLETQSVLTTSLIGGTFMIVMALSGFWLGSIVDHNKKKEVMLLSSMITLLFFSLALLLYLSAPANAFTSIGSIWSWGIITTVLLGSLAGNIRGIALPTLVTLLIPENLRDKANGISGMVMGMSSFGAGIASGLVLAYAGMGWVLIAGIILTALAFIHLLIITIPGDVVESGALSDEGVVEKKRVDIKGTIKAIRSVPGLFALIFFTMFNNFLGGVFAALMDPYGLSLVSVQTWGTLWGFLSLGFILGGFYIAKKGLGSDPLKQLFRINIITWTICIFFTIQPSIILLVIGIAVWVTLSPFIEATEQTIIQRVVPLERQGRVFGFAQSIEMSASPLAAFMVGPIAQFIFIPFMTTGVGVDLIGDWFGVGAGRGMALIFIIAGIIGLVVTLIAMRSKQYRLLTSYYQR